MTSMGFPEHQRLRRRTYSTLMDDGRSTRKKFGVRRIVGNAHVLRNLRGDIARVATHQQHGTLAEQSGGQRALLIKVAGVENGC